MKTGGVTMDLGHWDAKQYNIRFVTRDGMERGLAFMERREIFPSNGNCEYRVGRKLMDELDRLGIGYHSFYIYE